MAGEQLTPRALNRALLARQGLLTPWETPLVETVESIGALQAQYWPGVAVALWSRMRDFAAQDLYAALAGRQLVVGTLLRATLHMVSAREHPGYAAAVEASGVTDWRRISKEPFPQMATLRSELLAWTAAVPRSGDEISEFVEEWLARHPGALDEKELAFQRQYKWRPFRGTSAFVRVAADGRWERAPASLMAAPKSSEPAASSPEEVLAAVVRRHLRAFGPAAADDVADWIGWKTPPVRAVLDRLAPELVRFEDAAGRALYDLPAAPRPDPETPAPMRLLPGFDNVMLAYASKRRQRVLPDEHREKVYVRANLQVLPTFLVDGLIAGTWSVEEKRREATLTLRPFERLARPVRAAVVEEAERLVRFSQPAAKTHRVEVEP
ncbi:MAG TPA: winged helix DNA-binding domain-containing protein [Thermoanaerobaculia bacterium]|jgi:hypothetical protein|nr:winged helix DNA-binding domain-containing protein [Thermoanaerobaculia bacterium]